MMVRLILALAFIGGTLGCSNERMDATIPNPSVSAATAPDRDAAAEAPPPVCTPTCIEGQGLRICGDDDRLRLPEPCPEQTACLFDRCVPLTLSEGVALSRESLHYLSDEGWINAWAVTGPMDPEALPDDKLAAPLKVSGLSWRRVCAPGPFVPARPRTDKAPKDPDRTLMLTHLVSDRAREAWLKVGIMGSARVVLNGALVDEAQGTGRARPFPDERVHKVSLKEGVNTLAIRMDQSQAHMLGALARITDLDNRHLPGLRIAPPSTAEGPCIGKLVKSEHTLSPTESGAALDVRLSIHGALPHATKVPWKATLRTKKKDRLIKALGEGQIPIEALLSDKGASLRIEATPASDGDYVLDLALGAAHTRIPFSFHKSLAEKLALLKKGHASIKDAKVPQASLDSYTVHLEDLTQRVLQKDRDPRLTRRRFALAEQIAAAFAKDEDPYPTLEGLYLRAYRSEIDGQLQRYAIYVPPSYSRYKDEDFPLIVAAHGLNSKPQTTLMTTMGYQTRDRRSILVAPWGYKHSGQRLMGEHDTMRVIEEVRKVYRINPRRVSITGASLGGTVAWVVPLHHPGVFSAMVPLCGYPNLQTYKSVTRVAQKKPWEEVLISKRSISNYAGNALHTRVRIIHGGRDAPERSSVVAKALRKQGYWHIFDIQDDLGHNVWDYAYEDGNMLNWLKWRSSPDAPKRNRLVTADYRYDRSRWLRLISSGDYEAFADIDATWSDPPTDLTIETRNVEAFEIDISRHERSGPVNVLLDKDTLKLDEGQTRVVFTRSGESWTIADRVPSRAGKKRKGVAGPLDDVQTHPQIVVYGTQDPTQITTNKLVAEHFSQQDRRTAVQIPIRADTEITDAEIRGHSLILIGNPASNALTARFIENLPVKFEPNALTLGTQRHEGADIGASLIHPHPLNPDEYLVLHAGVGFRGTLASRHIPELVPDYLVYDHRITVQRWAVLMDRREALAGGFFSQDWKPTQ